MLLNCENLIDFFGIQPDYNPGVDYNDKKNNIWLEGTVFSGLDAFIVAAWIWYFPGALHCPNISFQQIE